MSVDTATVKRIAELARIGVDEAELAPLAAEMNQILTWVEQLGELDTDAVAPMASAHDAVLEGRADVVNDGDCAEAVLANAPAPAEGYFAVPKVVE